MASDATTWGVELERARVEAGDTSPVIARAPQDDATWSTEFDSGYGLHRGLPVLAWSEERVYFPVVYDGAEWLDSAPRNPVAEGQEHVGSE